VALKGFPFWRLFPLLLLSGIFFPETTKAQNGEDEEEEVTVQAKRVSCTSGPFRVKLPKGYPALRKMAVLKRERVLYEEDAGTHRIAARELRFVGLEMVVFTSSAKPGQYQLARLAVLTPKWRITGPLRVGTSTALALKGVTAEPMPRSGEITLEGEADSILLTVAGGRVQAIDYECATD
jgi:hypothetical protein